MNRLAYILIPLLVLALLAPGAIATAAAPEIGANEIKMGQEAVAEATKQYKLSDNAEDLKRLREMGNKIAAVANKQEINAHYGTSKITPFEYTFDIIEDKDVNAFSVPGGRIFVYRGLLDFAQSDQELAGVLAHEIVHASHHHMVYLLKKQASLNNVTAIALLAVMLGGSKSTDIANVALGVQLFQIAKLNGYGMQAERDADNGAVFYTKAAGYNPVGLLTFLERLAQRPELVELGIYRSHPIDADRVRATRDLIKELGLPINRRETTNAAKAEVRVQEIGGVGRPVVLLRDALIYAPAGDDGKASEKRAHDVADSINASLDAGLKMNELKVDAVTAAVIGRGQILLRVSAEDARLMEKTPSQVAQAAGAAIRNVVWKQMVDTVH